MQSKPQISKRGALILLSATIVLAAFYGTYRWSKGTGTHALRVGYSLFPPYLLPGSGPQSPSGLAANMISQAALRARIPIVWVNIDVTPDEAFRRNLIDFYPLLTLTNTRKATLHVSQPWWQNETVLISTQATALPNREATAGKRIAIRGMPVLEDLAVRLFRDALLVRIPRMEDMLPALCSGSVDGVFLDLRLVESQMLKGLPACVNRPLRVASLPGSSLSLGSASTKQTADRADAIFARIADLAVDGSLSALAARWSIYTPFQSRQMKDVLDAQNRASLMRFGFFGLLLVLILVICQNRRIRRARLAAEESQERFDAFMKHSPMLTFIKDDSGQIVFANPALCRIFDTSPGQLRGDRKLEFLSPAGAAEMRRTDAQILRQGGSLEVTQCLTLPSGESRYFMGPKFLFRNSRGEKLIGGTIMDVTEHKKADAALRFSQFAIDASHDSIFWLDSEMRIVYANQAAARTLQYSIAELMGQTFSSVESSRKIEQLSEQQATFETVFRSRDGSRVPVEISANYLDFDGSRFVCCMARDITERKRAEQELSYHAGHDLLTGLPNRRALESALFAAIETAHDQQSDFALVYLDLDGFKLVNDTLGHAVGDRLLRVAARRMQFAGIPEGSLFRMGGDEFTVLLTDCPDKPCAQAVAHRLLNTLQEGFHLEGPDRKGHDLTITASVGVCLYPAHGTDVSGLLQNADAAMYESKRNGKNRIHFYDQTMGEWARERLELENQLRRALDRRELSLHYQPEIHLKSGEPVRFEALLRWHHPHLGSISPARFIPIAEDTGLIVPIGNWVLEEACSRASEWQKTGSCGLGVAVNVSVVQFVRPDFVATVFSVLEKTGLPPHLLELELTETVVVQGVEDAAAKVIQLRSRGITVSVDDFGTGYSSLSYLRKLPVDNLKIDRSFVCDLATDRNAVSLARALVSLAHSLGLKVVVEGIETEAQLAVVREIGGDIGQGYLLGRPAELHAALDLCLTAA